METKNLIKDVTLRIFDSYNKDTTSPALLPEHIPDISKCIESTKYLLSLLIPGRFSVSNSLESFEILLEKGASILESEISNLIDKQTSKLVIESFINELTNIRLKLIKDIEAALKGDPAANNYSEVILAYPGILAVGVYRIANFLFTSEIPLIPRIISEWAHSLTGIDIHPGAQIEEGFFIDHGTGVVIGETCKIGKNVKIYQGVTLGARSFSVDEFGNLIKGEKRHPTVEDSVIIYANTTILGGETVIGKESIIGGNIFLMESIPEKSIVISKSTSNPSAKNFNIISRKNKI